MADGEGFMCAAVQTSRQLTPLASAPRACYFVHLFHLAAHPLYSHCKDGFRVQDSYNVD